METRKEKIIEILRNWNKPIYETRAIIVWGVASETFDEVADAILAIPLDVPSEEELEMQCSQELPIRIACWLQGAKWAIEQVKVRNQIIDPNEFDLPKHDEYRNLDKDKYK